MASDPSPALQSFGPGLHVINDVDLVGSVLAQLRAADLANCAAACKTLKAATQFLLDARFVGATARPASATTPGSCAALIVSGLDRYQLDSRSRLTSMLPLCLNLQALRLSLPLLNESMVCEVVDSLACLGLTELALTDATMRTRAPGVLAQLLPRLRRIATLSLANNRITDHGFATLQPAMTQLSALTALDVSGNVLSALEPLQTVLDALPGLCALDVSRNPLRPVAPDGRVVPPPTMCSQLVELRAANLPTGCFELPAAPMPQPTQLAVLDLARPPPSADYRDLPPTISQDLLSTLHTLTHLTELVLTGHSVQSNKDSAGLANALKRMTHLRRLELSRDMFTPNALATIAAPIATLGSQLTGLSLGVYRFETFRSLQERGDLPVPPDYVQDPLLAASAWNLLLAAVTGLRELRIQAAPETPWALLGGLRGLSTLDIMVCGGTDPGMHAALREAFSELQLLRQVKLVFAQMMCPFGPEGDQPNVKSAALEGAVLGMVAGGAVTKLEVRRASTPPQGQVHWCQAAPRLAELPWLRSLNVDMWHRRLNYDTTYAYEVFKSIRALTELTELRLTGDVKLYARDVNELAGALKSATQLRRLSVTAKFQEDLNLKKFGSGLQHCTQLTFLNLQQPMRRMNYMDMAMHLGLDIDDVSVLVPHVMATGLLVPKEMKVLLKAAREEESISGTALGHSFACLQRLQVLELHDANSVALSHALRHFTALTTLDLSHSRFELPDADRIGKALGSVTTLAALVLDHVIILPREVFEGRSSDYHEGGITDELGKGLAQLTGLTRLSAACMKPMQMGGMEKVVPLLENYRSLQVLNIRGNGFHAFGMSELKRALMALPDLVELEVDLDTSMYAPKADYKELQEHLPSLRIIYTPVW